MRLGRVVIVGAGPSGCYAATRLAQCQLFEAVHVYEKQETVDPSVAFGRNINVTLCKRGIDALNILGAVPSSEFPAAKLRNFFIHTNQGIYRQAYGGEGLLSVKRNDLYQYLQKKAQTAGAVFHFGYTLESITPQLGNEKEGSSTCSLAVFANKNGEYITETAALVIGADGVNSSARRSMFDEIIFSKYKTLNSLQVDRHQHPEACIVQDHCLGYREISIPSTVLARHGRSLEQDGFHIWGSHDVVVLGLPSSDGTVTLGVYMQKDQLLLKSMKDIVEVMQANFSDLKELLSNIDDLYKQGACRIGSLSTVSSPRYNQGNAVLIGDAAHAMLPFLGQGLNSGLEDVVILMDALNVMSSQTPSAQQVDSLCRLLEDFSKRRKRNIDVVLQESLSEYERLRSLNSVDLSHEIQDQVNMSTFFEKISSTTVSYDEAWRTAKEGPASYKGVGEHVLKGETLAVYESVKTVVTIRSPCEGVISDISYGEAGEPFYKVKNIESDEQGDQQVALQAAQASATDPRGAPPVSQPGDRFQGVDDVTFNHELYQSFLTTTNIGRNLVYMKTTGSTMDDAKTGAQNDCPPGSAYMSETMTAGRGRQGRTWKAPPVGNIYVTVVIRTPVGDGLTKIQFAAAVAILKAVHSEGIMDAKVKWPNDVWVNGHKLAGILVEAESEATREDKDVDEGGNLATFYLGMGINMNADIRRDVDMRTQATSMFNELGHAACRERVLANIFRSLEVLLPMEFGDILKEFMKFPVLQLSSKLTVYPKDEKEYAAIFDEITLDGKLHVRKLESNEAIIITDTATSVRPQPERVIYVYNGEGSSEQSVSMLHTWLQTMVDTTKYQVKKISPMEVKKGAWRNSCSLFAIGGGHDTGYISALQEDGLQMIREYVHHGGSFLGICAGAYLGCSSIEFDKEGPLEVCGKRQLGFFQGKCVGPRYPGFQYNSESGAHAASIRWKDDEDDNTADDGQKITKNLTAHLYFNGGGTFVNPSDKDHRSCCVLATYDDRKDMEDDAAIVRCRVGEGVAILSGIHFEYLAEDLDLSNEHFKKVVPKLKDAFCGRDFICGEVLKELRL